MLANHPDLLAVLSRIAIVGPEERFSLVWPNDRPSLLSLSAAAETSPGLRAQARTPRARTLARPSLASLQPPRVLPAHHAARCFQKPEVFREQRLSPRHQTQASFDLAGRAALVGAASGYQTGNLQSFQPSCAPGPLDICSWPIRKAYFWSEADGFDRLSARWDGEVWREWGRWSASAFSLHALSIAPKTGGRWGQPFHTPYASRHRAFAC